MKILIVGGAGYIGGALTDILMDSDHDIRVYDRLLYEESYRKPVSFVYGDIRDGDKLKPHLDWADVVVWLAALVGDPACTLDESLTVEINRDSVQFLKDNYKGRIIYMSSCSVYGAGDEILTEDSSINPLSLYARGKIEAEEILAGSNSLCFRLGTLHGISDCFSRIRFDLVVNTLVMRAIFHNKVSVFGGNQFRPLLHVRDVAQTISNTLNKDYVGVCNLHAENLEISDIADKIKEHFPALEIESSDVMFQDKRNYRVSSDKAKKELGFNPTLTVDDAIEELKELLKNGRIKDSFLKRFSNYLYLRPLLEGHNSPLGKEIKLNF
jgi:nucleoside-diphosphate-sugar epimerase